jgi:pimeloyl-ACP methyl ester carboxylesterase
VEYATNRHDGTRIAYRHSAATGAHPATDAAPIVLVHGTALSQAIWRGFGYLKGLTPDRAVITLDLRGHGRSDKPHDAAAYDMGRFVDDVIAVLDALALDRVHYLGYSLGARVGFSLAAAHPERLAGFVSVAGAPGTGPGTFDRVFFEGSIDALERGGMEGFLAEWQRASGTAVDPITRTAFLANDAAALAAYMRETERQQTVPDDVIRRYPMPLLLLAGTRDRPRLRAAEHVQGVLPSSQLTVLDGATHADTPRHPLALPAIREFLAAHPA